MTFLSFFWLKWSFCLQCYDGLGQMLKSKPFGKLEEVSLQSRYSLCFSTMCVKELKGNHLSV